MAHDSVATLPNLVSLSRLAMAAVFPAMDEPNDRVLLVAAAAATDFMDGYLARSSGAASRLGALIDPIADRCFVLVALGTLLYDGVVTLNAAILLSLRDMAVIAAFAATRRAAKYRDFAFMARPAGKVVTVLQLGTLAVAYLAPTWLAVLVPAVAVASLVAIADYTAALWRARGGT